MTEFERAILIEIAKALRAGTYVGRVLTYGRGDMKRSWGVPLRGL